MLPILQLLWDAKKRKNVFDRQIKEAELEQLKKSIRPIYKECIQQTCDIEKPVAYGKKANTYYSTEGINCCV